MQATPDRLADAARCPFGRSQHRRPRVARLFPLITGSAVPRPFGRTDAAPFYVPRIIPFITQINE